MFGLFGKLGLIGRTLLCASVLMFAQAGLVSCNGSGGSVVGDRQQTSILTIEAKTGVHQFSVELADTPEKKRIGLMFRESLARDAGMLFDFGPTPQPVSMWMKNTLISLDMAFIDANGVIVDIAANTPVRSTASIAPRQPVVAVLEVNAGVFDELGVTIGDQVDHKLFRDN